MVDVVTNFAPAGARQSQAAVPGINETAVPYGRIEYSLELVSIPASGAGDNQVWQVQCLAPTSGLYVLNYASFSVLEGAGASWSSTVAVGRAINPDPASNIFFVLPVQDNIGLSAGFPDEYWSLPVPPAAPGGLMRGDFLFASRNGAANQAECFLTAFISLLVYTRDQAEFWAPNTPLWTR